MRRWNYGSRLRRRVRRRWRVLEGASSPSTGHHPFEKLTRSLSMCAMILSDNLVSLIGSEPLRHLDTMVDLSIVGEKLFSREELPRPPWLDSIELPRLKCGELLLHLRGITAVDNTVKDI